MFLWGLAWHNIRRNWIRTVLVVAGMAVAAFILSASTALPSGHLPTAHEMYRAVMGGDLVIYPVEVVASGSGGPDDSWAWQRWDQPWVNDLASFHPSVATEGLIRPVSPASPYFERGDLPPALIDHPDVVGVEPLLVMPGIIRDCADALYDAPLRAVNVEAGRNRGWEGLIVGGRYFQPEDEGAMVALVNAARPAYRPSGGERQYPVPPLWEFIELMVPALAGYRDGYPVYDYSRLSTVRLRVVGHFELYSYDVRPILDEDENLVRDPIGQVVYFPHYWHTPQVMIPESTWRAIHEEIGGGHPIRSYQLGVDVRDTLEARTVARQLSAGLPGRSVLTVGDQAVMAERVTRISHAVPAESVPAIEARLVRHSQPVDAPDLSRLVAYLSFALAGCLVMANMHVLVAQRRGELGILRAVGMSGREVVLMILYEVTVLSLIGSLVGFSVVQLIIGSGAALSGVGLSRVMATMLASGVQVVGATVLIAIAFGAWPAVRAATATTMEVLTGE